ncbi:MAG: hypothetical protein M3042_04095 [Actinomycetota bacterium]|nr:hypothetical protein [Actinomycetota bacterium]
MSEPATRTVILRAGDGAQPRAWRPLLAISLGLLVLLVVTSMGYGYHRDELYFLSAGHHLAWGYPDQPPFTPLVARAMSALAPGALLVLRLPSALAAAGVALLTGLTAAELGGGGPGAGRRRHLGLGAPAGGQPPA